MFRNTGWLAATLSLSAVAVLACGSDGPTDPTDVTFGETTFVIVANPVVNDDNEAQLPTPGSGRSGVSVSVQGGPSGTTDANGVVVLSPIAAGSKSLSFSGSGTGGSITASISERDLREIAVATSGSTAGVMANVQYAFGGTVVEITPSSPLSEVNDALSRSNTIVFFRSGTYTGDLEFSGSNVTLFGEGTRGGTVTLNGNVTVGGSRNRIRGARVSGTLTVPGSDFGMSFSRVVGAVDIAGSNGVLLNNEFCSTDVTISGSGTTLLGNAGLAPIAPTC